MDDLRSAYESRHPGTCSWILDKPEFRTWTNSDPDDVTTRMLWLTGVPGAGKTVLSSFVINSCSKGSGEETPPPTLYFFFKNTDSDKNSMLAATRSLVFQLYSLFPTTLAEELMLLRDNSGKEKALSEQGLWDLFVKHAKGLDSFIIVLDALDECNDVDWLLRHLVLLLQCCHAKIFIVSRREKNIALVLGGYPHLVIGHEDIDADIRSYITAEIERIPRFQGRPVQQRMIHALTSGHDGMFLWAYLMVRELNELGTVRQVDDALKALPTGLQEMHESIITRLNSSLRKAHRDLTIKILTWVVCAVRPLRLQELQKILRFEIRQGDAVDQSLDDDDLLYSEKDIELACGALVICRNGTLQLIHLSTKEILMRKPRHMNSDDSRRAFYVDSAQENPQMALLCVSYISTHLSDIDSITRPNLESYSRLKFSRVNYDSTGLVTKSPFIHYASISWQAHLIDGRVSPEIESVMYQLQRLLDYHLTLLWIESCVFLHPDIIWTLERSCKEVTSWADSASVPAETACHKAVSYLSAWSSAVVSMINEYGHVIEMYPYEIHYLDMENVTFNDSVPGSTIFSLYSMPTQGRTVQERMSVIRAIDKSRPEVKFDPCRRLQSNLQNPSMNRILGFVLYDSMRDVYFSAEYFLTDTEILRVQERKKGRRLHPVKSTMNVLNVSGEDSSPFTTRSNESCYTVRSAVLSPNHMYLAILYDHYTSGLVTSIWSIERHLDFANIRDRRPWARRLHCIGSADRSFRDSCLPLIVGQDGYFYSPSGQIHPERGLRKRIPDSLIENETSVRPVLAFSGNGQTIIRLNRDEGLVEKVAWLEGTVIKPLHSSIPGSGWQQNRAILTAISQTARFIVYEIPLDLHYGSTALVYLLDCRGCPEQLQVNPPTSCRGTNFYFHNDEKYLLGVGRAAME